MQHTYPYSINTIKGYDRKVTFTEHLVQTFFYGKQPGHTIIKYKPEILFVTTKTTRIPTFWEYPLPPHDYPYYSFILDPKSKQDKVKITNLKNYQEFKFWSFA